MDNFAVIDFETTGLSPAQGARITEVAVVMIKQGVITDRYQSLVNAGVYIPAHITQLTGISNSMVAKAPAAHQVMSEVLALTKGATFVAHNASFDMKFLAHEAALAGHSTKTDSLCTLLLARRFYPEMPNHKLGTLAARLNLAAEGNFHRALVDADVTARLFLRILSHVEKLACGKALTLASLKRAESVRADALESIFASSTKPMAQLDRIGSNAQTPQVRNQTMKSKAAVDASILRATQLVLGHSQGIGTHDFRSKGGAFWIEYRESLSDLGRELRALGFGFVPARGFWIK